MKKQIIVMAAVALITAVIVLGAVLVGVNINPTPNTNMIGAMAVMEEPAEPVPPEIPKTIAIPGYAQLVMNAGDIMQHVELHNPVENPCYFVISIILPDGTEIFRSGLIEPGQKTDAIRLSKALKAGTYKNAILRYTCYSTKDKAPMNGADTKFTLEVV